MLFITTNHQDGNTSAIRNIKAIQLNGLDTTTAAAPLAPSRTGRETEMTTYTIAAVQSMRPCQPTYTTSYLTDLFAGRETVTILDVFDAPIPDADKVWFAVQPGVITKMQIDEFLERTVTRAVTNHALHCGVPEVEEWAKKWLSGEDRSARAAYAAARAAYAAAYAAARAADVADAAADAAYAAARAADAAADAAARAADVADAAARAADVADAAARADRAAARAAADAAYAAERARQVDDLRHIVTREVEA